MNQSSISEQKTKWYLESTSDTGTKWIVPIEPLPFTIGRDKDCNLTLQSKWISRRHAQIHLSGSMLWIRDFGGINGTLLNHKRIKEAELIEVGDILRFGDSEFCVKGGESVRTALTAETAAFDSLEEQIGITFHEPQLQKLLRERAVVPHFQPILRLSDTSVVGYEILGRIRGSELPPSPVELFDIAAQLGRASELSALFREEGVRVGKRLAGFPQLFINTHPMEIYQMDDLGQSLRKIRKGAQSNPIILEINEKAVPHSEQMKQLRSTLTDLNIGLAYDDFGVGQTRLVELAILPPDFLKFDISIIHNIHIAPNRLHQMVVTFVKAVHELGIATIAEGIECQEESETCKQLGFEYAQGYLYSRPLPISEFGNTNSQINS
ncbi:MAG: EAL domain-containing protein [Desulfobacterales bacterium]|nr:EAL domain-containing protein [Desulfobacterales bacterium]